MLRKPLNLRNQAHRDYLERYCEEVSRLTGLKVELIIIDTVARAMAGANENAPDAMSEFVRHVDALRHKTDAHVALCHHTGKDPTKGARGHSSLLGALDTEFEIKKGKNGTGFITATAQRDIEDEVKFRFTRKIVTLGVNKKGKPVTSCIVEIAETRGGDSEWPKALTLFKACLIKAILAGGVDHQPEGKGPMFKAVQVDAVREAHREAFVHTGTGDPVAAERQAWNRARNAALNNGLMGGKGAYVWFARGDDTEE